MSDGFEPRVIAVVAPAPDRCPRCGARFRCGREDAAPCPCAGLQLSAQTLAALRERFQGCLCVECLREMAGGAPPSLRTAR
jgi:hypothetical protein